jgi:ABC-type branched-subunit amino acid transport system ATPase component
MSLLKNFWSIISLSFKKNFIFLLLLTFLSTFFEALSLGLVIPVVSIIIDPNFFNEKFANYIFFISDYLNQITYLKKVFISLFLLLLLFVIKNLYLVYLYHRQFKFSYNLQTYIENKLLEKYLSQNYLFFLRSNSSKLLTNITTEITSFINGFVLPLLYMLTDIFLVITILIVIFFLKLYKITFILFLIIFFGYLIIKKIHKYISQWGQNRQIYEYAKNKNLNHLFHGIKEVIIFNSSRFFLKNFESSTLGLAKLSYRHNTAVHLPKLLLETLGILSLVILIFYLTNSNFSSSKIIVITGFYVALAYRLIPCFNRIVSSYNAIKFYAPSLDIISQEILLLNKNLLDFNVNKISYQKELVLENISFKYSGSQNYIIKDVNLNIKKGEVIGFFGQSGSGKTTLLDIITGLLEPTSGKLYVDNCILNNKFLIRSFQNIISYNPQFIYLMDESIKKNIAIGIAEDLIDLKKINYAIKNSGLEEFINSLPNNIDTIVGERGTRMSGGQRQRLGIARSLYFESDIIIFDESTNSLDAATEKQIMDIIYSLRGIKTVIIVAHKKEILKKSDKIFSIIDKKLILENN